MAATSIPQECPYHQQQQQQQNDPSNPSPRSSPLVQVLKEQYHAQQQQQQQKDASPNGGETACPISASRPSSSTATSTNQTTNQSNSSACPIQQGCSSDRSASNSSLATLESVVAEPLVFLDSTNNSQDPNQPLTSALPTRRQVSSIPRAEPGTEDTSSPSYWVYPSQQQFYEAMKRKNYDPKEEDMAVLVPLHNIVNEMAWRKVMEWEAKYQETCGDIRLKRFLGKPTELSPKARLQSWLGYTPPFDRHDWVVDRCGKEVTYVIDFYQGQPRPNSIINIHIDARPALYSAEAMWDRMCRLVHEWW